MGMPIITPGQGSRQQAITDIITSIALEQTAISHILNAEGEKIQRVISGITTAEEIIEANNSVKSMINAITRFEMLLQLKLEMFEDCLCEKDCRKKCNKD